MRSPDPGLSSASSPVFVTVPVEVADLAVPGRCMSPARSRGSSSGTGEPSAGSVEGLATGETTGDVCSPSGTGDDVSKTKKASPPSPSFMA